MKKKLFSALLLVTLLGSILPSMHVMAPPDPGLIGYWHFDEGLPTAVDSSSNGNDGAIIGATYVTPGRKGSGALSFPSGSYVEIANEAQFDFARDDPFTLGAWIGTGTAPLCRIMSKYHSSGVGIIFAKMPDGYLLFYMGDGSGAIMVRGGTDIADGEWHHVFVTYDGSSTAAGVQIYVDGIPETMTSLGASSIGGSIQNNKPLIISDLDPTYTWTGMIDEVYVASMAGYHVENWIITESMQLVEDHMFARHAGIVIDEDGVTLDLNGYDVIGIGPLYPDDSPDPNFWYIGIHIGWKQFGLGGQSRTGVTITSTKSGSEISHFNRGIGFFTSNNNQILNLDIHDNIDGIYFWFSSENTIEDNLIHDNERHGIKLFGASIELATRSNLITNNEMWNNQNGVFLEGEYAMENIIQANDIYQNERGIRMWNEAIIDPGQGYRDIGAPCDNRIEGNQIHDNNVGINVEVSLFLMIRDVQSNSIRNNNIYGNIEYGIQTDAIVDARYNWWGSDQGPSTEKKQIENGDLVSEFVLFRPWLRNQV